MHKPIEAERRAFDEPPYIALRRLRKLPTVAPDATGEKTSAQGIPFVEDGITIPHGSLARMEYQRGKQVYEGRFLNGKLVVNGQSFSALERAAKP